MIKQGTVSILLCVHSIIHSILVMLAWRKLYGAWPKLWQAICILIHDVGHVGLNYLDNYEGKKQHWILGARIGRLLFGQKGFCFLAGHCSSSGYPLSDLYKADKYSWYIAPVWWLRWNCLVEPKITMGYSCCEAIARFKQQVKISIDTNQYRSTHSLFLERCVEK